MLERTHEKPVRLRAGALALAVACLLAPPCRAGENPEPPDWRHTDPAVDRSLLLPTAQTLEKGQVSIYDVELIWIGASYGLRDDLELSFASLVTAPIVAQLMAVTTIKWRVYSDRIVTLSAMAGFEYSFNFSRTHVLTPGLVALVDLHDPGGVLLWSTRLGLLQPFAFAHGKGGANTNRPVWTAATGPRVKVHRLVSLLAEGLVAGGVGATWRPADPSNHLPTTVVIAYGVRIHWPAVALDLGMCRPLVDLPAAWTLGFPWLGFTWRF